MPLKLENAHDIAAALEAAETKAGGTVAERLEALRDLREVAAAMRADPQGFVRNLDAIQHGWYSGVAYVLAGGDTSAAGKAAGFAAYEVDRRKTLGL